MLLSRQRWHRSDSLLSVLQNGCLTPHQSLVILSPRLDKNLVAYQAFMQEMSDIRVHRFWSSWIVTFNLGNMKTSSTTLLSHWRWHHLNSLLSVLSNGCTILCWLSLVQGGTMLHCRWSFCILVHYFRSLRM